jgi:hypothetical protein
MVFAEGCGYVVECLFNILIIGWVGLVGKRDALGVYISCLRFSLLRTGLTRNEVRDDSAVVAASVIVICYSFSIFGFRVV